MMAGRKSITRLPAVILGCVVALLGGAVAFSALREAWALDSTPNAMESQHITLNGSVFALYPYGAVQKSGIWQMPGWTLGSDKPIDVCWERLQDSTAAMRDEVRDAVAKTWAFYGMVSFVGWSQCKNDSQGIRIGVSTVESGTVALGQHLDGRPNGMLLQMDFSAWPYCADKNAFCVRATAVHEFGHALAFVHEQNRNDAPDWCKAKHSGDLPDWLVTNYDPQSIMNYCNCSWQNDGLLSPKDIEAVTRLYGARA